VHGGLHAHLCARIAREYNPRGVRSVVVDIPGRLREHLLKYGLIFDLVFNDVDERLETLLKIECFQKLLFGMGVDGERRSDEVGDDLRVLELLEAGDEILLRPFCRVNEHAEEIEDFEAMRIGGVRFSGMALKFLDFGDWIRPVLCIARDGNSRDAAQEHAETRVGELDDPGDLPQAGDPVGRRIEEALGESSLHQDDSHHAVPLEAILEHEPMARFIDDER